MSYTSLDLFKKHTRADEYADDDVYLQHLLDTAEKAVIKSTRRSVEELTAHSMGELPEELQHAAMMLAAHWYNQRESASATQMHEVPDSIGTLIKPFMRLV